MIEVMPLAQFAGKFVLGIQSLMSVCREKRIMVEH